MNINWSADIRAVAIHDKYRHKVLGVTHNELIVGQTNAHKSWYPSS